MTHWLLPLLIPLLDAATIPRLPAHFEPREDGFLARTGQRTYLLTSKAALKFSAQAEMRFAGAQSNSAG
jgi:hypothetical protein